MLRGIPSKAIRYFLRYERYNRPSKAKIYPAHEGNSLVNNAQFLVLKQGKINMMWQEDNNLLAHMSPVERARLEMRRGSLDHDVFVER